MTRYQLAKVISWAETLHTRKRLQKVVFLLQAVGCPLETDFILHHHGPYSEEVSRLTDEMVRLSLLDEAATDNSVGQQFSYRLSEQGREQLSQLEQTDRGQQLAEQLTPFEQLARSLLRGDLKELEVAATMMYFRRQDHGWTEAAEKARTFKNIPPDSPLAARAESLARSVEEAAQHPAA